jgi:aminoglycoside 3-N-acetyltransferase I
VRDGLGIDSDWSGLELDIGGDFTLLGKLRAALGINSAMSSSVGVTIRQLSSNDVALMEAMMTTFGEAFDEVDTYTEARPSAHYLERLLDSNHFIALTALKGGTVVGGLAAYELQKFERERSEIYIYDLAVAAAHRREGIATALIEELKVIAAARGAYVIFVQADRNDGAAMALYTKLGAREDVLHFDIKITW